MMTDISLKQLFSPSRIFLALFPPTFLSASFLPPTTHHLSNENNANSLLSQEVVMIKLVSREIEFAWTCGEMCNLSLHAFSWEVQLESLRKYKTEARACRFKKSMSSLVQWTTSHTTLPAQTGKLIGTWPKCSQEVTLYFSHGLAFLSPMLQVNSTFYYSLFLLVIAPSIF